MLRELLLRGEPLDDLESPRCVGVTLDVARSLELAQLVGHTRRGGQTCVVTDLSHARWNPAGV